MKQLSLFSLLFVLTCQFGIANTSEKIHFKAEDGLEITGDLYLTKNLNGPFIILFHQAGWSRGEYLEIAPKLNDLGYNCLAVDQRSGEQVNEVINETAQRAKKLELSCNYPDAMPDMLAAIQYVKNKFNYEKLILWGSSYSSALVLKIAGDHPQIADAVLSFAPGEYFARFGKTEDWITQSARNIHIPVFITSAREEHVYWKSIYESIPSSDKQSFLPETEGNHGSRALWNQFDDSPAYWKAVKQFLNTL